MTKNAYLIVGVRGTVSTFAAASSEIVPTLLLTSFHRWGLGQGLWEDCDAGFDFSNLAPQDVCGWLHVSLRARRLPHDDVPIYALVRQLWDGLELFGEITISGVDVIFPADRAGLSMRRRLGGYPAWWDLFAVDQSETPVSSQIALFVDRDQTTPNDRSGLGSVATNLTEVLKIKRGVSLPPQPHDAIESNSADSPFPRMSRSAESLLIDVPALALDYFAWLAEAAAVAVNLAGARGEVYLRLQAPIGEDTVSERI